MKSVILPLLLCALLAPALAAAEASEGAVRRPLNLSLPRDFSPETWNPQTDAGTATLLPDIGASPAANANSFQRGSGRRDELRRNELPRDELPYGAGFEARHSGNGSGSGGNRRDGGRGGGRGR